ncbi:MAG: hypothetical protein JW995_08565 [Melioribacteraceae bacterium]|nr:hypothetical protein [Melioribacteraceae bacterium]
MKHLVINRAKHHREDSLKLFEFLRQYLFLPIKSGILGFSIFFVILIATKFAGYILGTYTSFTINADDVILSSIGFVLLFILKLTENSKERAT